MTGGGIKRWKLPVHEGNQLDPGIYPEFGVDTFQMVPYGVGT